MAKIAVDRFRTPRRFDRSAEETICHDNGHKLEFASGRIANIWGENGHEEQKLILLLHGWESRGTAFYALIDELVKHDFKVIAWNAPAHGASPGEKTEIHAMIFALVEDMKQLNLQPAAIIGHSMGGAMLALLHKYINLPHILVTISSPTQMLKVFTETFKKYGMNDKVIAKCFARINSFGDYNLDEVSLINSDVNQNRAFLVVHDEQDKEIPFSQFSNLQAVWKNTEFHSTQNLGHRRIIRDKDLAVKIAAFIEANL